MLLNTLSWLWPLLYMGLIYYLSSIPGTPHPEDGASSVFLLVPPSVQNLLHIPVFGGLAWLWHSALDQLNLRRATTGGIALAITLAYGLFDEWHQLHVPGRYGSLVDMVFNGMGAAVGVLLYHRWQRRRSRADGFI